MRHASSLMPRIVLITLSRHLPRPNFNRSSGLLKNLRGQGRQERNRPSNGKNDSFLFFFFFFFDKRTNFNRIFDQRTFNSLFNSCEYPRHENFLSFYKKKKNTRIFLYFRIKRTDVFLRILQKFVPLVETRETNGGANIYARRFKFDGSKGGAVDSKKQSVTSAITLVFFSIRVWKILCEIVEMVGSLIEFHDKGILKIFGRHYLRFQRLFRTEIDEIGRIPLRVSVTRFATSSRD